MPLSISWLERNNIFIGLDSECVVVVDRSTTCIRPHHQGSVSDLEMARPIHPFLAGPTFPRPFSLRSSRTIYSPWKTWPSFSKWSRQNTQGMPSRICFTYSRHVVQGASAFRETGRVGRTEERTPPMKIWWHLDVGQMGIIRWNQVSKSQLTRCCCKLLCCAPCFVDVSRLLSVPTPTQFRIFQISQAA